MTPGSEGFPLCKSSKRHIARCLEILIGLAIWITYFASAQASPGPSRIQQRTDKPASPVVAAPIQAPVAAVNPPPVPVALPPDQAPPRPPVVTWADKQLTIDAENSTLTAILLAIRAQTGASIEIPASADSERVALHIGPAPIRDVLSSLLYGTNFDYVIQAADDDPDTLRSVVLTAHGGMTDDTVVGSSGPTDVAGTDTNASPLGAATGAGPFGPRTPGMRLMKGYAAPGKRDFQASAEAALAAQEAAAQDADSTAESASPTAADTSAPRDPAGTGKESGAANSNGVASTDPQSAGSASATSSAQASSMVVTDLPSTTAKEASSSSSGFDSNEESAVSPAIQNMQRMFELRRQIQAQQNQPAPQPAN